MSNDNNMAGKKALVTGSGTGIGREIALEFARQGADVVLHYSHSSDGAESAAEEIRGMGRGAEVFQADFDKVEEVLGLARRAEDFLGQVDCLINNAGISFNKPFPLVTPEQFDLLFHVNIRAQYFLTQEIAKGMIARKKGAVCNLTSIHGLQGAPEHSLYAGTKGAIIAYTRALAMELAHQGVRVNAIAPGWVNVENHYKILPGLTDQASADAAAKDVVPAARAGRPLDIAKLAIFLCSDNAEFIVGQTLVADGGSSSLMSLFHDYRAEQKFSFGKGYVPGIS
ncbi:MAG: glucose 1-dehydrogenase [Pirellulales bacterium]|nr:glucose 1-dehydrogenase [Pirellulales bacterium]